MNYRTKIYKYYSSRRMVQLAPASIEGFKPRESYFKYLLSNYFPENKRASILEIGCGHGAFQYYMKDGGYTNIIGIDVSPEQVQEAHRLGIQNVVCADIIEYLRRTQDASIDLLVAFDVLEHFKKEEISDLVDEFHRVLKKGGRVLVHLPNAEGPFGNLIRESDFTHEISFTRQSIAQIFLSSNFTNVESFEDKPVPHGIKSFIRYVLWEFFLRPILKAFVVIETGGCDRGVIFTQNFLAVVTK